MDRVIVCFAKGRSWYAPIIRWLMDTWYNHAFFLYHDEKWGGWMAADILSDGPVILPAENAIQRYSRVQCHEAKADVWPGLEASRGDIGGGYDWLGLFGGLAKFLVFKLTRFASARPLHWISRYTCFEWVATVLQRAKIHGADMINPATSPPEEFYDYVTTGGGFSEVPLPFSRLPNCSPELEMPCFGDEEDEEKDE